MVFSVSGDIVFLVLVHDHERRKMISDRGAIRIVHLIIGTYYVDCWLLNYFSAYKHS